VDAGYVVVTPEYYKNTAGNYLSDACKQQFTFPSLYHLTRREYIPVLPPPLPIVVHFSLIMYLAAPGKEYTKADSRYATRDAFIISMEAVTAFLWGPCCPIVVYGIFNAKSWRFTLMAIVSVGQIYGDVLYYGTCYLENFIHSRPEALYFWGYFVVLNALWILIPLVMLLYAAKNINAAVASTSSKIKSR